MDALIIQQLLFKAVADVFYFPIWWYSKGAVRCGNFCLGLLKFGNERLSPGLWLKNIFVPMFGQYDWQGRLISFFMRLVQVVFRVWALLIWLIFCFALFLGWMLIPVIMTYGFVNALFLAPTI